MYIYEMSADISCTSHVNVEHHRMMLHDKHKKRCRSEGCTDPDGSLSAVF